jgi:hypothetical protein
MLNPETRIAELTRLGFSTPLLELSAGRKPHSLFQNICNDPWYIYHGGRGPPGLELVPIWEEGTVVTAALETETGLQIVRFDLELPNAYSVIARSEQGLWADVFVSLLDGWSRSEADPDEVAEAAKAVGFRFLRETLALIEAHRDSTNYTGLRDEFVYSIS